MKNMDIAIGLIKDIAQPIDQMQKLLVCDTGSYMMSVQWCDVNKPEVGQLLALGYDGFYRCYNVKDGRVLR